MQTFLEIGLANAIMAAALALLAAGVALFCRRPAVRHTLWLLVLLKLITPPVFSVSVRCPAALLTLLPKADAVSSPRGPSEPDSASLRQVAVDEAAREGEEDTILDAANPSSPAPEAFPHATESIQERLAATRPTDRGVIPSFSAFVFTFWLTGAVLWFSVAGTRIYCFQRLLRYGRAAPAPLQEQAELLAARLGLARCPIVWLVPGRVSPLLWALGRNLSLVVPEDLLDRLGPEQRAGLFMHELAHARRRDHWVRWLEFVVSGLYWWLPVAWWARRELQRAEEECCDAWVVWTLPAAAKAYARALLQTVDFLDARPALPPVASGIGHVHLLKRRLTMIVRQPFCPQLPWPVYLGVVVLGSLVLPFTPQRLVAQDPEAKPAAEVVDNVALVRAEQDTSDRDVERRLRVLEEKMDRLMQKLEAQRGERSEGRSSRGDRAAEEKAKAQEREKERKALEKAKEALEKAKAQDREKLEQAKEKLRAAAAEQKAKAKQLAEAAKEKLKAERSKELPRKSDDGKAMNPEQMQRLHEQIERLQEDIHDKISKALDPERMKKLQKTIEETVDKNINPERMQDIQKRIDEALKRSAQQLNEALKRSTEELGRAQNRLREVERERAQSRAREAERARANAPKSEKSGTAEQRDLERRMERLEQKMDRVLQALEKSGKSL
jgi:beta-lactamase regulating signal transducer with metallopeptidase domain